LDIARERHEAEAKFRKDVELALNNAFAQVKNQARQTQEERALSAFGIRRGFEPAGFRSE
jgi:hypothetical protein